MSDKRTAAVVKRRSKSPATPRQSSAPSWRKDVDVLYSADAVQRRVRELGVEITRAYAGEGVTVVGIMKGSFIFLADLVRQMDLPVSCEFIGISSYGDAKVSSGVVRITSDLSQSIEDKHVLIVEDIIDTGLTMQYLLENFRTRRPRSVKICTLLEKPENAKVKVPIDYIGFSIPNAFVVGYGLDYAGRYRNLPFIGVYRGRG
jgi:hypoxanthine phosphoribosyltransferase